MKNNKIYLYLMLSLLMSIASLKAQNTTRDVVFLKNGSIIKGSMVEPDSTSSIKIQTADGSIFVYAMTEVEKIEKETIVAPQPVIPSSVQPNQETREIGKPKFSIYGGVAIPVGDFAGESARGGAAKTGFTIGMQVVGAGQVGFLVNASYASNPCNLAEIMSSSIGGSGSSSSWSSILLLTGLKIGTTNPTGANFFFAPVFGLNIGTSPKVDYTVTETSYQSYPTYGYVTTTVNVTMSSATSTALAYGMMMEINAGRVTIGARYVASKPKYEVSADATFSSGSYGGSASAKQTFEQSTSIIQMFLGISL